MLTVPPKPDMGDFAFPCFTLAKKWRKAPPLIAQEIAEKASGDLDLLCGAKALGGYVNLSVDRARFADAVLREATSAARRTAACEDGAGQTIAIDYSSPNIAKPFHVGHLRSTIIGGALVRIFEVLGYKVIGINHVGDWGTQFGRQIAGLMRFGKPEDADDLMSLNRLYVKFHEVADSDPELVEEAREWFRRQESGDHVALALWRRIRDTSLDYFKRIYERLGVRFDSYTGESFFNDKMDVVIEEARAKDLATVSDGALIIDLSEEGIDTPALLEKADGTTLYLTRDVAAARYRHDTYGCDRIVYVVASGQSLHFRQLFTVLKMLGHAWSEDCVHVNFGLVQGMSTRKGNVIYLEELLDEARDRALAYMRGQIEKRLELEDEETVAEADYRFDWDLAISFEGDTGPYLMSAHARIAGILRNCGLEPDPDAGVSPLVEPEAHRLYEPSVLANYLLELARGLHASYTVLRVKGEEAGKAQARLLLFTAVKQVLRSGLTILGIRPLERM
ncbi:Arginine--tRNA ligase [Geodia barretti]|uniref:Probable arginine--tRNA ligase, mitochondrial n=1 Tax=Geodia barretti TaxID=519541 RepID=A0AA35RP64_GEOBA|nr:Arginine--tRNA ligase [Geodia barretti]